MANNIKGGQPNVVIAKVTASFVGIGITVDNIKNIFLVDFALKSFDPSRTLNPITMFEQGKGYYINAKEDMDLEEYVGPPFPQSTGILLETDTVLLPESE